jgi:uncharacterized protein
VSEQRETVLVTGASSGLGLELAQLFAADGSDLILVARRIDLLDTLAGRLTARFGVRTTVIPSDLGAPDAVPRLVEAVDQMALSVDVLVNSAGIGHRSEFIELPPERVQGTLEVNISALTRLTHTFLPGMIARGRGGVINLGSLAGFLPGPHMATYYASKAYVLALSEALQEEVRGSGVTVCCLAPGPTHTEFVSTNRIEGIRFFRLGAMQASRVAKIGYRDFRAGRAVSVPGAHTKAATMLLRLSPRPLTRRIARWMNVQTH